jgi:hypothetical protein
MRTVFAIASVRDKRLEPIDYEDLDWSGRRFQSKTELFLQRSEERRTIGIGVRHRPMAKIFANGNIVAPIGRVSRPAESIRGRSPETAGC